MEREREREEEVPPSTAAEKNERAEEKGEGRVVMRDSEGNWRERGERREKGRQHLLTAEPFIDKIALM